uniref:Uncharacterized protein n=1 Tax=Oryza sativa subsp. japonica TaxID=39947 RepID=Q7XEB5_ORYSJ|nr:hypothetical protein LOC_Os10g29300 [Oryza sativa Japonica Group]
MAVLLQPVCWSNETSCLGKRPRQSPRRRLPSVFAGLAAMMTAEDGMSLDKQLRRWWWQDAGLPEHLLKGSLFHQVVAAADLLAPVLKQCSYHCAVLPNLCHNLPHHASTQLPRSGDGSSSGVGAKGVPTLVACCHRGGGEVGVRLGGTVPN